MARTNSALMMSMGSVSMWGFSPAFDVCSGLPEWSKSDSLAAPAEDKASVDPINVLLSGPGDVRHVLATIARRRRCDPAMQHRPVHIYLFEKAIETLARDLLLIQVALDTELPLRQRCNTFLEIFGNARVQVRRCEGWLLQSDLLRSWCTAMFLQERTSAYTEEQAKLLIDFVYNDRGRLAGLVDISHLKMRTHDDLIDSFRSWFQKVKFDGKRSRSRYLHASCHLLDCSCS
jgi:dynein assembly factor 3